MAKQLDELRMRVRQQRAIGELGTRALSGADLPALMNKTVPLGRRHFGIDDSLGRIFNAFFTTKPRGTGLGLPAVRQAVESHGGHVEVNSVLGRGSIFALSSPLSAQDLTNERENPRQKENPHRRCRTFNPLVGG